MDAYIEAFLNFKMDETQLRECIQYHMKNTKSQT